MDGMSDVRAAAERVLACDVWYPRDRRHVEMMTPDWENAAELARMVLAEHPADDDELVTVDWLGSLFVAQVSPGGRRIVLFSYKHGLFLEYVSDFHGTGERWTLDTRTIWEDRRVTRSDVRRLLRALGITVTQ